MDLQCWQSCPFYVKKVQASLRLNLTFCITLKLFPPLFRKYIFRLFFPLPQPEIINQSDVCLSSGSVAVSMYTNTSHGLRNNPIGTTVGREMCPSTNRLTALTGCPAPLLMTRWRLQMCVNGKSENSNMRSTKPSKILIFLTFNIDPSNQA